MKVNFLYIYKYKREKTEKNSPIKKDENKRDLEREFGRFGDIKNLQLKKGYAFIEYYNKEDAKDAIRELNNQKLFGQQKRIYIEEAKGGRRERERRRNRRRDYRSLSSSRDRSGTEIIIEEKDQKKMINALIVEKLDIGQMNATCH